jgi:hypothetical protein
VLPTEIEEYLAFNSNPNYGFIKLHFVSFDAEKNFLTAHYLYTAEVEDIIDKLKPELEKLFTQSVGLSIGYKFVYGKSYIDETILRLRLLDYLRNTFAIMAGGVKEEDIKIDAVTNGYDINLYLTQQFAEFLQGARSFEKFKGALAAEFFCEFNFYFNITQQTGIPEDDILEIDYTEAENPVVDRVDKVLHIKNSQYLLGRPIKEKPIKIEYLRLCNEDQITAGEIDRLTKREYTRANGEKAFRYTFTINDGAKTTGCVWFPNKKNLHLFERLHDGDFIVVMGVYSERNGWRSLNVSGISVAEKEMTT